MLYVLRQWSGTGVSASKDHEDDYHSGINIGGPAFRAYAYSYDLAGNRLSQSLALNGGMPTVTSYTYNAANQIASDGTNSFTYDNNGNLTSDGVNSYAWDRANRLLTAPGSTAYKYDGVGNRIRQTVSSVVTDYLLDVQPGLAVVLRQTTGGNVDRFIHSPRGIHAYQDNNGDWFYSEQDGLGSVRGVTDDVLAVQGTQHYAPYGEPFGAQGSLGMSFGFTGEQADANELVFLRARYLSPEVGTFLSLDPLEGMAGKPMSLNGYSYVEGDVVNAVDQTGMAPACSVVPQPTMPSPTPQIPSRILFFSGSFPGRLTEIGPDPTIQAPVWTNAVRSGDIVQYPGSKSGQAKTAIHRVYAGENIAVIGYSAGADAAVIFADEYTKDQAASR